ncbi:hypothetical protein BKA57DRAFT_539669 [Linnemannia elongata]|nr:hypothetical protein BKA57DRAFT_539669 [Linnemannia elongata]
MVDNHMTLFCLVNGEAASNAFTIKTPSSNTVYDLKELIKAKKTNDFGAVDANKLTLWRAFIPDDSLHSAIIVDALDDKTELRNPWTRLFKLFPESSDDNTYIIIQRPTPAPKRDYDEDAESSSKRKRFVIYTLKDKIEAAGLTEKAVVDGRSDLSRLDNKERVSLLQFIGQEVDRTDTFDSLSSTARACRDLSFQELDLISTPSSTRLPVVSAEDLYVRQAYKDLYSEITWKFPDSPRNRGWRRVVVTGTSGIGKSVFLVYFTIRLLATSLDDNPPIVIFHKNGGSKCYVYGGVSTLRYGDIEDFRPFLGLRETWYLVDSSPNPQLVEARTVISASPKTLYSEMNQYQEIDKRVPWRYYMAPWVLEELERCRGDIRDFQAVTKEFMEELYDLVGGVPRYVLEKPKDILSFDPDDYAGAKKKVSGHLLHRWPSDDHNDFHLEWASAHVAEEVSKSLHDAAWKLILKSLITDTDGAAREVMFKTYVRHIFRKGGCEFQVKDLQDGTVTTLEIPPSPRVEWFKEIPTLSAGALHIPKQCNHACVDLLLASRHLLKVTVYQKLDIKGPTFSTFLDSLIRQNWISPSDEALLIFVVPSEIYDGFRAQKYLNFAGNVYETDPQQLQRVKQLVLKIDLNPVSTGQFPGLSLLR